MVAPIDRDADLAGLVGGVDGDLVVGLVALLDAEIVIEKIDVEIRWISLSLMNCQMMRVHLVAVHLDDRILDLIFAIELEIPFGARLKAVQNLAVKRRASG